MSNTILLQQEAQRILHLQPLFLQAALSSDRADAEIIEMAVLDPDGRILAEELIRPNGEIQAEFSQMHGLSKELLQAAPGWGEVWAQLKSVLHGRLVVVYDRRLLLARLRYAHQQSFIRWDIAEENYFDLMDLHARFAGQWDNRRQSFKTFTLQQAAQQMGLEFELDLYRRPLDDVRLLRSLLLVIAGWKAA